MVVVITDTILAAAAGWRRRTMAQWIRISEDGGKVPWRYPTKQCKGISTRSLKFKIIFKKCRQTILAGEGKL
jgi:hypothetical protein